MKHGSVSGAMLLVAILLLGPARLTVAAQERQAADWRNMAVSALDDELFHLAENYVKRYRQAAGDEAELRLDAAILEARALLGQGQAEEARNRLDGLAAANPESGQAADLVFWSARAAFDQGSYDVAIRQIEAWKEAADHPGTPRARRLLIKALILGGEPERALETLARFAEQYADHEEAAPNLLDWAALLIEEDQSTAARPILLRLVEEHAGSPEAQTARLWLTRDAPVAVPGSDRQLLELTALATNRLSEASVRVDAWYELAALYVARTNYTEAAASFVAGEALTGDAAQRSVGQLGRAGLLVMQGKADAGIQLAHEAVQDIEEEQLAARCLIDFAQELLDRKAYAEAHQEFQNVLEAFSVEQGRDEAWLGKGWSLSALERYPEAAEAFDKAAQVSTNSTLRARALIKGGDALFAAGNFDEARSHYVDFVAAYADHAYVPRAAYQVGECLVGLGRFDQAKEVLASVETRYPDDAMAERAAWRIARLQEEQGNWAGADAAYGRVLEDYPEGPLAAQVLQGRGLVRYRMGEFYRALQDFEQVGGAFPDSEQAEHALCMSVWCLYLLDREDEALTLADDFTRRYPASKWAPHLLFWMAEYAFNRGASQEAEQRFAAVAETYPEDALADDGLYWAGRAAAEQKDYAASMEYFRQFAQAYQDSPRMPEARFAQGDVLASMGEFAGAILAFEEVLGRFPEHVLAEQARGRKGDCLFTLGAEEPERYRASIEAYRGVAESARSDADLRLQAGYKIGRSYEKLGEIDKALEHYFEVVYSYSGQALERVPLGELWFSRAAFAAAAILETREQWREAVHLYRRVVAADVAASPDAQKRVQAVLFEHWRAFLP